MSKAKSILFATIFTSATIFVNESQAQWYNSSSNAYLSDSTKSVSIGRKVFRNKLDVNGNVGIGNGYAGVSGAPTDGMLVKGNVGIGTTTVGSKLQVNGNTAIGYSGSTAAPSNGLAVSGQVGIGTNSVDSRYKLSIPSGVAQIGPVWPAAGTTLWYQLGLSNMATTGTTDCILNLNSAVGQSGIEFFKGGQQKWYIYNDPSDDRFGFYNDQTRMALTKDGTLLVPNRIKTGELVVTTNVWADFVFKKDYQLPSLTQVSEYIKKEGHLPGMPSEQEVKESGVSVADMQVKLLQKVEELTLHMINLQNENVQLKNQITELSKSAK